MYVTPDVDEITITAEYTTPIKNIKSRKLDVREIYQSWLGM